MRVLGIETSCDETSAAIVNDGRTVRSSIIFSQIDLHGPYQILHIINFVFKVKGDIMFSLFRLIR